MKSSILIVDEQGKLGTHLEDRMRHNGLAVIGALERKSVSTILKSKKPDLLVIECSSRTPNEGLKLARHIRRHDKKTPIIMVVQHSSEALAVAALKAGINDYFKAPVSSGDLIDSVKRILSSHGGTAPEVKETGIIGNSLVMRDIKSYLVSLAAVDSTVLITGETGTGKELAAELIHRESTRSKKPFICINCAALPDNLIESEMFGYERGAFTGAVKARKGKFALASSGTLFLDEIGDMSLYAQAKVLRAIESKAVYPLGGQGGIPLDIRVIAATNQNPEVLISEGKFRKDLYYRLNVARVHLPPLCERKEDIPDMISVGIRRLNRRFDRDLEGVSDEAMASLFQHDWPGNIRELNNVIEASYISCSSKKIEFADLPQPFVKKLKFTNAHMTNEKDTLLAALCATHWNKSEAAKKLRWSRMKVYRALKRYRITPQPHPPTSNV